MNWQSASRCDLIDTGRLGVDRIQYRKLLGVQLQFGRVMDDLPVRAWSRLDQRPQLLQHIIDGFNQFRSVADQLMATVGGSAVDAARNGEDLATLFHRKPR